MNSKIKQLVEDECDQLEATSFILEAQLEVLNQMPINGTMAEQVANQKKWTQSQIDLNKLTIAAVKAKLIKMEEKQ